MAFLDNSGDIILDAVLTDTGRYRLAQGNGSFKIAKFALGDDEINYGLYNKLHTSGSAYYDLEVLQTPILEAFTNNTANLNSRLMSLTRTNILYMPILKLNKHAGETDLGQNHPSMMFERVAEVAGGTIIDTRFYIAVDSNTDHILRESRNATTTVTGGPALQTAYGIIQGFTKNSNQAQVKDFIRVDQGLETTEISPGPEGLETDLMETAFILEMDYRLGWPKSVDGVAAIYNFIDDDNIASYYLSGNPYVNPAGLVAPKDAYNSAESSYTLDHLQEVNKQVFYGPRGNTLHFRVQTSQELRTSTYLFEQLGFSEDASSNTRLGLKAHADDGALSATTKAYFIDTTIRVTGANTGFRLDIPVRYVKIE